MGSLFQTLFTPPENNAPAITGQRNSAGKKGQNLKRKTVRHREFLFFFVFPLYNMKKIVYNTIVYHDFGGISNGT